MSLRITSGYRTGIVAGGPQGEAPNVRAAKIKGSAAEMIMTGGCRGCIARGRWPGAIETTAHMHTCPGRLTRDPQRWRKDVGKKLTYLAIELRKKGRDARSAYAQVCQACEAVSNCDFTGERYEALRHTVGGAIPRWDDNIEKHDKDSSKAISTVVTGVQRLFAERLRDWTAYTAPTGWNGKDRLDGKGENGCDLYSTYSKLNTLRGSRKPHILLTKMKTTLT